jgi:hypothetical protein
VLINVRCKALPEKSSGTCGEDDRATEAQVPEMFNILVLEDSELLECSRYQETRHIS